MHETATWVRSGLMLAMLAGLAAPAAAQETGPDRDKGVALPAGPGDPEFQGALLGDQAAGQTVGGERVIYAVGGVTQPVWIRQPGFEVRCESIVIWGDPETLAAALERHAPTPDSSAAAILGPVLYGLYAEGDVFVRKDRQILRGERVLLDFKTGQAYLVDARVRGEFAKSGSATIPLSVRAGIVRGVAKDRYEADDASFTTCSFADPHFDFRASTIELDFSQEFVGFETGWWPSLRADTILGDDTPLLVLPKLGGRTFDARPLQDINFGTSDRFGTEIELLWGGSLKDEESGSEWGDWRLHTDYRSSRGPGVGLDLELYGEGAAERRDTVELRTYYQRDSAERDEFSERAFDGLTGGSTQNDRGRVQAWFRSFSVLPDWRVEGEVSTYSDRGFLSEFERDELRTDKQQETWLRASRVWGNEGVSLLAATRIDDEATALIRDPSDLFLTDFAVQTEVLPSATYHLIAQPILTADQTGFAPLQASIQASAANIRRIWDERTEDLLTAVSGWRTTHVTRGDVEARFGLPFSVGPLQIVPSFGGSYMAVDSANGFARNNNFVDDTGSLDRWSGFWSLRVGTETHRLWGDVNDTTFSLNGLRHVVSADVQVFDRYHVNEPSSAFQTNDLIDDLDEVAIGSVRLRNRLQTKREGEVVDWIDYEVRFLELLEDSDGLPTLLGHREDALQPLQRLDFPGQDKYAARQSGAAYHQHRLRWALFPRIWLVGEADYDMQAERMETSAAGARWAVDDQLSLYAGRRTIFDDSRIWTLRADYRLTNKWVVSLEQQENTRRNKRFDTTLRLYRAAHDYTIAVEFQSDGQLGETSLALALYPNHWLGSRGDPLARRRDLDYAALRWYR